MGLSNVRKDPDCGAGFMVSVPGRRMRSLRAHLGTEIGFLHGICMAIMHIPGFRPRPRKQNPLLTYPYPQFS